MSESEFQKHKSLLDALFYGSYKPIYIDQLKRLLGVSTRKDVRKILRRYIKEFNKFHSGIRIVKKKDYYFLTIKDEYIDKVKRFLPYPPLTPKQLEILGIVYSKPRISLIELRDYFGPRIYADIKKLAKMNLIKRENINGRYYVSLREEAKLLILSRRRG
jgi:chromosome segregation and condensation protein ScpB